MFTGSKDIELGGTQTSSVSDRLESGIESLEHWNSFEAFRNSGLNKYFEDSVVSEYHTFQLNLCFDDKDMSIAVCLDS
jgi:hypothetical protein